MADCCLGTEGRCVLASDSHRFCFCPLRLQLRDRRAAGHPQLHWVFQRHLEATLYGRGADGGSSGAIWKILNSTGLGSTALQVNGAAIQLGQVTQAEYDQLLSQFKLCTAGLDPSSIGRIRSFTIVPVTTAAAVARAFGRSATSMSFLRALAQPVPQAWELQEESEANEANREVDLLLQEKLEGAQDVEVEEVESFEQELQSMVRFTASAEEEGRMTAYAITNPCAMLTSQLKQYVATRTSVFDARRSGSAVVSATVEGDTQSVLRFFGYLQRTHRVPEGSWLYLSAFMVRSDLGDLVQTYAEWLRANQGLRYGSIANYLNGLAAVTAWVYRLYEIPEDTAAMDPSPLAQIYNLRGQAEGQSKTENKRIGGSTSASVAGSTGLTCRRRGWRPSSGRRRSGATSSCSAMPPPSHCSRSSLPTELA
jgi:hypothetical protein